MVLLRLDVPSDLDDMDGDDDIIGNLWQNINLLNCEVKKCSVPIYIFIFF